MSGPCHGAATQKSPHGLALHLGAAAVGDRVGLDAQPGHDSVLEPDADRSLGSADGGSAVGRDAVAME